SPAGPPCRRDGHRGCPCRIDLPAMLPSRWAAAHTTPTRQADVAPLSRSAGRGQAGDPTAVARTLTPERQFCMNRSSPEFAIVLDSETTRSNNPYTGVHLTGVV